jgi:LuxR family maltose regulon positive regulatory protein
VVLDDVQLPHSQSCLDALVMLVDHLGDGSQLVIAGRREPAAEARLRAESRVLVLGQDELAMDRHEVGTLLRAADVELSDAEVADLVRRTEGWPAAVDLATLSLQASGTGSLLVDYLQSVLLSRLAPSTLRFLTRTAVLERMSGPLCDAIPEATGSAETLELLERSNLLVVPLDRRRHWYRYHHLFRELLRAGSRVV